jgi:hypothetical protein
MKVVIYRWCCFIFLIFNLGVSQTTVHAQERDVVLVEGNPPLTQLMVDKGAGLLQWSLEIKLSSEQKSMLQTVMVRVWKEKNAKEMQSILEMVEIHDKVIRMSEAERNNVRGQLQAAILKNLRNDPDDEMSRMLVSAYDAARSANSKSTLPSNTSPTLTRSGLRVGADGFTGLYRMVRGRAADINSSIYQHGYQVEYITFLPDGHVFWRLPSEGLLYFDPSVAQKAYPDDWGTYEIKNGEIHVWRGPEKRLYVITRNGEKLNNPPSLGRGVFLPVPAADGLKLEGKYRRYEQDPFITFTADGNFRDEGAFRNFGDMARPDRRIYQDDGRGGTGTYLIEQNTLELRYSDGRVKRFPFIAFPDNLAKKPALDSFILFQTDVMTRS